MTKPLLGVFNIPGDKSISHRALILSSQTVGTTIIKNLATGKDVYRTLTALRMLGVKIKKKEKGVYEISGVGVGGLAKPNDVLNMGNSGTGARLFTGLLSPYPFITFITGDTSLRARPMKHVTDALREMGVDFMGDKLPLAIIGMEDAIPIEYRLPIPSAQLKSAILLAALNTQGISEIIEPKPFSRDHSEIMLQNLGVELKVSYDEKENKHITLKGQPELFSPGEMNIPSDPSSAAFLVAAALILPESEVLLKNICINPYRMGFYESIKKMGADISFENEKIVMGEKVADIKVQYKKLKGITINPEEIPAMIDEIPILAILAAYAEGRTKISGLAQLRVKESDRVDSIIKNLTACGVTAYENNDSITIEGNGEVIGDCTVKTFQDHRIAMSFFICSLASKRPIIVKGISSIKTSFPEFLDFINITH